MQKNQETNHQESITNFVVKANELIFRGILRSSTLICVYMAGRKSTAYENH